MKVKVDNKKYLFAVVPFMLIIVISMLFIGSLVYTTLYPSTQVLAADANIREIQRRLRDWGYYDGEINGEMTNSTVEAVKYFQRLHDITPTGQLDGATQAAIGVYVGTQTSTDLYLLAKTIHAEARGEPYVGQVAVGAVILNRVKHPEFPNTIYGVVYQPWAFTAVHDGQINLEPNETAYQAAQDAINGWDPSYGSIFYYNPAKATSQWIFSRQTVVVIGKHVFAI